MRTTAIAVAAITAAALAGCGSAGTATGPAAAPDKTEIVPATPAVAPTTSAARSAPPAGPANEAAARQLVHQTQAAAHQLSSLHVSGQIADDGRMMSIDLSVSRAGDCSGMLVLDGYEIHVVRGHGHTFIEGDAAFWRHVSADADATALAGAWVNVDHAPDASKVCQTTQFLDLPDHMLDDADTVAITGTTAINGVAMTTITATGGFGSTVFQVAEAAPHYLYSAVQNRAGEIDFSAFDEPFDTSAPANALYPKFDLGNI